jgi:hypothetical protein
MTVALTDSQQVVLTVLWDRARSGEASGTAGQIAQQTAWPGGQTYGVDRARRILGELRRGRTRRVRTAGGYASERVDAPTTNSNPHQEG